jgi:hypothetical protein
MWREEITTMKKQLKQERIDNGMAIATALINGARTSEDIRKAGFTMQQANEALKAGFVETVGYLNTTEGYIWRATETAIKMLNDAYYGAVGRM